MTAEPTVVRVYGVDYGDGLPPAVVAEHRARVWAEHPAATLVTRLVTTTPWEAVQPAGDQLSESACGNVVEPQVNEVAENRVWQCGDPEPADEPTVRDRVMRDWAPSDAVWHTASSGGRYRGWDMLLSRYGPLTEVSGGGEVAT